MRLKPTSAERNVHPPKLLGTASSLGGPSSSTSPHKEEKRQVDLSQNGYCLSLSLSLSLSSWADQLIAQPSGSTGLDLSSTGRLQATQDSGHRRHRRHHHDDYHWHGNREDFVAEALLTRESVLPSTDSFLQSSEPCFDPILPPSPCLTVLLKLRHARPCLPQPHCA